MSENNDSMNTNETMTSTDSSAVNNGNTTDSTGVNNNLPPEFARPEDISFEEDFTIEEPIISTPDLSQIPEGHPSTPNKKKGKAGIIIGVLACALIVAFLLLTPTLKNVLSFSSKSSEEYFTSLVRNEVADSAKLLRSSLEKQENLKSDKIGIDSTLNVTLGDYAKQFLEAQNINIDNINMTMAIDMADNQLQATGMLGLNNTDLLSYLYLYNLSNLSVYFKLPELSEAYVKVDGSATMPDDESKLVLETYNSLGKLLTAENVEKLLVTYSNVILDNIKGVEIEKNQEISVNDKKGSFDKLTVNFSEKDLKEIQIAILKQASTDDTIKEFAKLFSLTGEVEINYNDIPQTIEELEAELETAGTNTIASIDLYAKNDSVSGWAINIISNEYNTILSFYNLKDNTDGSATFNVTENDVEMMNVTCNYQKGSNGYNGDMNIVVNTQDTYYDLNATNLTIDFTDVAIVDQETGSIQGKFNIKTDASIGVNIDVVMGGGKDSQSMELSLIMMGQTLASLKVDSTKREYREFTMPSESETIYDMESGLEEYAAELDIYSLIGKLSEAGLDVTSLLD